MLRTCTYLLISIIQTHTYAILKCSLDIMTIESFYYLYRFDTIITLVLMQL